MNTETVTHNSPFHLVGEILAEGKTKRVSNIHGDRHLAELFSKDDITAGDGKKHDIMEGKGLHANRTACNVFQLLQRCDIPVAFMEQNSPWSFIAPRCHMLPYEVVVRREAHGSYLKRNPHLTKGQRFPKLLVEFFLKTKERNWKGNPLICDDPLMEYDPERSEIKLFDPAKPIHGQQPFLVLHEQEVFTTEYEWKKHDEMRAIARKAFLVLEKAWQLEGGTLVDFKVEFGLAQGMLLLADVIDNDSWRVLENGAYIDKQVYRDGGALDDVAEKYRRVAEITSRFRLPRQQIILWCGSEKDDVSPFTKALTVPVMLCNIICSIHKEPERAARIFQELVHKTPDSVVIAYVGRSNGAGPTLSAMSTVPVISVPANVKEFPDDVWSSLRAPSNVPVMTVLEPANAVLAALQILCARNPRIYAHLMSDIEMRRENTVQI